MPTRCALSSHFVLVGAAAVCVAVCHVSPLAARVPERTPLREPRQVSIPLAPPQRAVDVSDPLLELQWGLDNVGQLGGLIDADIDAPEAWQLSEGAREILVGVLDSGVDLQHPDIQSILWTNQAEVEGRPGVDDDGNGCIDDLHGCWFSQGCTEDTPNCAPQPIGTVTDPNGHGTAVAGIIAAAARNGEGGRGVAPGVRIVPLQVATAEGLFWDVPVERALHYAAAVGCDVINISAFFDGNDRALQARALQTATDSGALVVASAGNWGVNLEQHTADLPYLPTQSDNPRVLLVAAVDRYETLISYAGWWGSDWSPNQVDIAGPSQAIVTPRSGTDDGYSYSFNGTSAAAPFVSGAAALVFSVAPDLDALEVAELLSDTSDPVESLQGRIRSGGRVNANNAARAAAGMGLPPVARSTPDVEVALGAAVTLSAAGSFDPDGGALSHRWWFDDGTAAEGLEVRHTFDHQGVYHVTLEVTDAAGMTATSRTTVTIPIVFKDAGEALESPHPYAGFYSWDLDIEGARYIRLHFERLELRTVEGDFVADDDAVSIVDFTGTPVWTRSEDGQDFWTPPIRTYGEPLALWLDGTIGGAHGFTIDRVQYADDDDLLEVEQSCGGCGGDGQSPTPAWLLLGWLWRRRRLSAR